MTAGRDAPLTRTQQKYAEDGARLVQQLAAIFARQWRSIPLSDFVSAGHAQVVRAAQLYVARPGASFEAYLRPALNGAMLDLAHRERFQVQRLTRHVARGIMESPADHWTTTDVLSRPSSNEETVVDEIAGQLAEALAATVGRGGHITESEESVVDGIDRRATLARLRVAIAQLEEPERSFAVWYLEEGVTIGTVARRLKVNRRTVFRLQQRVRDKLVVALGASASIDDGPETTRMVRGDARDEARRWGRRKGAPEREGA